MVNKTEEKKREEEGGRERGEINFAPEQEEEENQGKGRLWNPSVQSGSQSMYVYKGEYAVSVEVVQHDIGKKILVSLLTTLFFT